MVLVGVRPGVERSMLIGSLLPSVSSRSQILQAAQGSEPQQRIAYTLASLSDALSFSGYICWWAWASKESWEWNPSITKKLEWTRQCGVGGEGGSGDSISPVKHISHWLQCSVFSDVSFPMEEDLGERGGGKLARGKTCLSGCEQYIGSCPSHVLKVCHERWNHLAHFTIFRMASRLDKARQHVQVNWSEAGQWLLGNMQRRWGHYSRKMLRRPLLPKRRARSWTTIKWTASSENAYDAQARLRIICSLSHAAILTPLQTFILHIFVQHLFNEERKTKKTCFLRGGSKLSWNTAHVQKRTCNAELEEFPPSKHTHGFSTQTKK